MKKLNITTILFCLILFSINLTAQLPSYVPANGLLGWWPFTGNANDLSVNGNNGTNNGATLTTDRFSNSNSAYSFNGTSNCINVNDVASLRLNNIDFSISFWTYINVYGTGGATAFIYKRGSGNQNGWGILLDQGTQNKIGFITSGGIDPRGYSTATLPLNSWHNVIVVYRLALQQLQFYIDGVLDNTTTGVNSNYIPLVGMPSPNANCNSIMRFGQDSQNNYYWLNGKLDDIGIWNRALTACEINQLYTSTLNSPTLTVNSGAICAGQNFTINPNGANTYTIQGGNAVVSPSINTTYTVIGTSAAGCISQAVATSSLIVNPNPIITVNNGTICSGKNFTINPTGASTYTIQGGSAVVSPTSNANYTVVGTSTAGCVSQSFATSSLIVNANPTITVNSGAICSGESFTINPNGANTYTIQGANAVVSPTSNASFTVAGTSTAGCVSQAVATSSLTVNLCVGINNQNMGLDGVSIYPNPNNGGFTIELVSVNNTYITITNVLGQIIKTQKAELNNQINLNAFEKGIYFISVMENNQSVYKGSIIKEY